MIIDKFVENYKGWLLVGGWSIFIIKTRVAQMLLLNLISN